MDNSIRTEANVSEHTNPPISDSDAESLGWQKTGSGDVFTLYNITAAGRPLCGSTVTDKSLLELNLQVPGAPLPQEREMKLSLSQKEKRRNERSLCPLKNNSGGILAKKILLVHADKDLRDSVRVILKSSGYLVVEAADSENALSLLAGETVDLILLNITLPDKSSFRVLDFLNENQLTSKVIVITGTVGLENTIKSAALGARDYVTKPYDPDYLLKSVDHVLSDRSPTNLKLHIINAGDFIKSTPTGDLDLEGSTRGLSEIAAVGTTLQDYTVLIDLRDVKSRLSTNDIYQLALELAKYGETFQRKTAVLVRPDKESGQATLFESAAQYRGFRVRAFTVFEEAINWLSTITQFTDDPII